MCDKDLNHRPPSLLANAHTCDIGQPHQLFLMLLLDGLNAHFPHLLSISSVCCRLTDTHHLLAWIWKTQSSTQHPNAFEQDSQELTAHSANQVRALLGSDAVIESCPADILNRTTRQSVIQFS